MIGVTPLDASVSRGSELLKALAGWPWVRELCQVT